MAFFNPLKQVAGYREAVEAETRGRDITWLNLTERICGVEVLAFTPEHFNILSLIGSQFLVGGFHNPAETTRFLWVVSPRFIPGNGLRARARKWRFAVQCRRRFGKWALNANKLKWVAAAKAVETYFDEAFFDRPGSEGKSKKMICSCMASIVDLLAFEYGWSKREVLTTPFKQIFQLYRAMDRRKDPAAKIFNPSQILVSDYVAALNEQRN